MVRARSNGHGGKRTATPGKAYSNRTDLAAQPIRVASGQEYGQRQAQEQAQRAVPLPAPSPIPTPIPLSAPTQRPAEPVTSGLPLGPGPGPEALMPIAPAAEQAPMLEMLQALYAEFPNNDLRSLIEEEQARGAR